jgi:hypothetical protein
VGCYVYFEGENLRPYFEGHIIEIKDSLAQGELRDLAMKIIQDVDDMNPNNFANTFGFSSLYAYVALPYNTLSELPDWFLNKIREREKETGGKKIGVIRLGDDFPNEDLKAESQWPQREKNGHPFGPPGNRCKYPPVKDRRHLTARRGHHQTN